MRLLLDILLKVVFLILIFWAGMFVQKIRDDMAYPLYVEKALQGERKICDAQLRTCEDKILNEHSLLLGCVEARNDYEYALGKANMALAGRSPDSYVGGDGK